MQQFLVVERDVVFDTRSKAAQDYYAEHMSYPPRDPQPAVVSATPALVLADDAPSAALEYVRARGRGNDQFPSNIVVFGAGAEIPVDLATVAQEAAPA